jgi:hypothetical protein
VRSDWDPDHNKKPGLQKRYPDITRDEWLTLLNLIERALTTEEEALPQTALRKAKGRYLGNLFDKIDARLGEGENT